jgi:hypothetical protein
MSEELEKSIQKKIMKWLEKFGCTVVKYPAGRFGRTGVSDLIACVRGRYFAIEVKRPGNEPTPIQANFLEKVRVSGGLAMFATSVEDVKGYLRGLGYPWNDAELKELGLPTIKDPGHWSKHDQTGDRWPGPILEGPKKTQSTLGCDNSTNSIISGAL